MYSFADGRKAIRANPGISSSSTVGTAPLEPDATIIIRAHRADLEPFTQCPPRKGNEASMF